MMLSVCNNDFFDDMIIQNKVPPVDSVNFLGIFSNYMDENKKEDKVLSLKTSCAYASSKHDDFYYNINNNQSFFVGCQLTSKYDGIGNRSLPIDLVILLDISGSMSSNIDGENSSCLELSKIAIKNLILKLNKGDGFSLITFNDQSKEIIPLTLKENLKHINKFIDPIKADRGTSISEGLNHCYKILYSKLNPDRIQRVLMITDMNDTSQNNEFLEGMKKLAKCGIYLTIIGVGFDFNMELTEKAAEIGRFNYFTVTRAEQINERICNQFDLNFFPIANNINLSFESSDIFLQKVYGTKFDNNMYKLQFPEWKLSGRIMSSSNKFSVSFLILYFKRKNKRLPKPALATFIKFLQNEKQLIKNICEIKNCYASEIMKENLNDKIHELIKGKFFLLKCRIKSNYSSSINVKLKLTYNNLQNNILNEQNYQINFNLSNKFSYYEAGIANALCLFYYTKFIRKILKKYYNKDGAAKLRQDSKNYLKIENMFALSRKLKYCFNKYWSLSSNIRNNLLDNMDKVLVNVLDNINNYTNNYRDNLNDVSIDDMNFDHLDDLEDRNQEEKLLYNDRFIINPYDRIENELNFDSLNQDLENYLVAYYEYKNIKSPPEKAFSVDSSGKEFNDYSIYCGSGSSLYYNWRYYLYCKSKNLQSLETRESLINLSTSLKTNMNIVDKNKSNSDEEYSFFMSKIGILTINCIYYKEIKDETLFKINIAKILDVFKFVIKPNCENELLYGNAGYLYSLLLLRKECDEYLNKFFQNFNSFIFELVKLLYFEGIKFRKVFSSQTLLWPFPKREVKSIKEIYLGACHGVFGVLYMIISAFPIIDHFLISDQNLRNQLVIDIKNSLDYLLQYRFPSGNFYSVFSSHEKDQLLHFCHGSPGAIPLYLKAYQFYSDNEYLNASVKAGEDLWIRGILKKGNSLCHGIAGNAYPLYNLYKVTNDLKWKIRSYLFAKACFDDRIQSICNIYEDPTRTVKGKPDRPYSLMEGDGGIICLLSDLLSNNMLFPGYEL